MSKPLTTRGPFDSDPGVLVRWMLKSGQPSNPHAGAIRFSGVRDGIQLYIPSGGRIVELDFKDVHEAGDLYVALEEHMENVAAGQERADGVGPVEEARMMGAEEREAMTPNVPRTITPDPEPLLWSTPRMTPWRVRETMGKFGLVSDVDPEFLAAMEDVVNAWVIPEPTVDLTAHKAAVRRECPQLAMALDRLAALNA